MSHDCGTVQTLGTPLQIGPDSGATPTSPNRWEKSLTHDPAPTGTRFVILHFMNVSLPANNRLEVDLGYDTDVFRAASGTSFWTRPINVALVGGGTTVPMRYITDGSASGGATLDRYGRGERLQSHGMVHNSITNCDPFLASGWLEPVFPHGSGVTVPKYDPFWICNKSMPPVWENVRCAAASDIRRTVARSVGMIVTIHAADGSHPHESVSSCSVTLIDADLVVLAGHCISNHSFEVPTSSVTFDYEVACDGSVLPSYNARFLKVIRLVKYRWSDGRDYAILQLRGSPAVPPIVMRNAFPAVGESVFGVHHPNGAVKKVSPSASGSMPVTSTGDMVRVNLDVAGGSSGSGLFDMSGRIVGVLASGGACSLGYSAMRTMLNDPILVPDPPEQRAVMLVIDRSGSMSESAGDGRIKINEVRAAAELFVSMLRASMGNQAGLVTFSSDAASPPEFALSAVTSTSKQQIINLLPGISPGGRTSIGDGLAAARNQFGAGAPPRAILVLTDGMENEPQAIADVTGLGNIEITAIGFGTESNLDGARLSSLAQTHGGFYKRAGSGLELRKFFALAFGDIFEAGALADPQLHLPASQKQGSDIPFRVCGEEAITVVTGWDTVDAPLLLEVRTPTGQLVNFALPGVDDDNGATWGFARIPLPHAGERDGVWRARVVRRGRGGGEFPPPDVDVNYFINVIARGGPGLRPFSLPARLYTGDVLHPKVILQFADETVPLGGKVALTLKRPATSVGTILSQHGLGPVRLVNGDTIPARQATLTAIEKKQGKPITGYVEETHTLTDDAAGSGTFMPAGLFGKRLDSVLVVEGNYTFHARAQFGISCTGTREVQWSHHVSVGIDPGSTTVVVTPIGSSPGGDRVQVTFTPRDRFGNYLGPGSGDDFSVTPLPGGTLVGGVKDLGDGRYAQEIDCDPDSDVPQGVVVTQPERDPIVLAAPDRERRFYRYAAMLLCGSRSDDCCGCASVTPGRYATAITVLNTSDRDVPLIQRIVPTEFAGAVSGRWPEFSGERAKGRIVLKPFTATTIDCCSVHKMLMGAPPAAPLPLTLGMVTIESPVRVDVTATYTVVSQDGTAPSLDVKTIDPSEIRVQTPVPPPSQPQRSSVPQRSSPPPRPQDTPRQKTRPAGSDGSHQHDQDHDHDHPNSARG